jgi:endogenous inhibitor of DNA gyrase (YacG/DUF329 family)
MNPNVYEYQKKRHISRKYELINLMGGKCTICGYDKNYASLEFHHLIPKEKEFPLDARHLSNSSITSLLKEAKKCILLCANCHRELHNPDFNKDKLQLMDIDKKTLVKKQKKQSICPVCGKSFDKSNGKIFCSKECRIKQKGYPSKEEVIIKYEELKSQQKVADFYGLTRKIIVNILKT